MVTAVILAGGLGTRLWPISRKMHPKQFSSVLDASTMFQDTLKRVDNLEYNV